MEPGTELAGDYRLDVQLGYGGMGEVWAGFDLALHRKVAVKLILASQLREEQLAFQVLTRFRREGAAAAQLRHPNITTIHYLGEHNEMGPKRQVRVLPFLVME
ncbi:hypothetical protein [Nonomuraea zeae]|uniref:hypothetical protein n=1 Tax=Nonomuraea zeae TaxID=1642303 RepID=UPI0036189E0C